MMDRKEAIESRLGMPLSEWMNFIGEDDELDDDPEILTYSSQETDDAGETRDSKHEEPDRDADEDFENRDDEVFPEDSEVSETEAGRWDDGKVLLFRDGNWGTYELHGIKFGMLIPESE